MMRVLHLYAGNLYGGVEKFLLTLHRYGSVAEMSHSFGLCFEGRLSQELVAAGADVHLLGPARMSRPWTILRARRNLRQMLVDTPFDVAVCHSSVAVCSFCAGGAAPAAFRWYFVSMRMSNRKHWVDRRAARTAPDLLISVSEDAAASGRELFPKAPWRVLHNPLPRDLTPLDSARRDAARAQLGITPDQVLIMQVSRMDPFKGHTQSLAALARLDKKLNWRCLVVGGAQRPSEVAYLATVKQKATELGLDGQIQFLGERTDVPDLLSAADVFLQANIGPEGFSIVFMEAFAAGLPIVTMRLGGAPELIDATCGVLAEPGDIDAVARGLAKLIQEPEFRRELGQNGRRRVQEHCDPRMHAIRLAETLHALKSE